MAQAVPLLLALLVNFTGILIFVNLSDVKISPAGSSIGKHIFMVGSFFGLHNIDFYQRRYRNVHWTVRSILEFIIGIYALEHTLCNFWYPLESTLLYIVAKQTKLLREHAPRNGLLYNISCAVFEILTHSWTPVILSIALSVFILVCLLHGTRTIDFRVLRCGIKEFAFHVLHQTRKGIKKILKSFQFRSDACE